METDEPDEVALSLRSMVKGYVRHSKTGKAINVKAHMRSIDNMSMGDLTKERDEIAGILKNPPGDFMDNIKKQLVQRKAQINAALQLRRRGEATRARTRLIAASDATDNLIALAGMERVSGYTRVSSLGNTVHVDAYMRSPRSMSPSDLSMEFRQLVRKEQYDGLAPQERNRKVQLRYEIDRRNSVAARSAPASDDSWREEVARTRRAAQRLTLEKLTDTDLANVPGEDANAERARRLAEGIVKTIRPTSPRHQWETW